ncbi:MAG: Ankyrin-2 [Peltula sp. TS41687]|nr:MAG: Ankyrin-2 [Peltula sp. TS41687]
MADPFQIAVSAIAAAEYVYKTCDGLVRFVRDARNSDRTAAEFGNKFKHLRDVAQSVWIALENRKILGKTRPPEREEVKIWIRIRAALKDFQRNLDLFEKEVTSLDGARTQIECFRKVLLHIKLQQKSPTISRFENNMDALVQVLQTLLLCLQSFVQADIAALNTAIWSMKSLATGKREEVELHKQHQQSSRSSPDLNGDSSIGAKTNTLKNEIITVETQNLKNIRKTLKAANTVLSRASNRGSDNLSTSEAEIGMDSDDEFLDATSDTANDDIDLNGFTALDVLESFIDRFQKRVKEDTASGNYSEAQNGQLKRIKYLEEREAGYGKLFDKAAEQEILAEIYYKQGNHGQGNRIIKTLLSGQGGSPRRPSDPSDENAHDSRLLYTLAKSKLIQFRSGRDTKLLGDSEWFAKRSFNLRYKHPQKEGQAFKQSVQLLIEIYKEQGNPVEAEAYSDLLSDQSPTLLPSSPSAPLASNPPCAEFQQTSGPSIRLVSPAQAPDPILIRNDKLVSKLQQLVSGVADEKSGKTWLMRAVECDDEGAVRLILDEGADIDGTDPSGQTALNLAIKNGNLEMAKCLLELGASLEGQKSAGVTPLTCAVLSEKACMVRMLLDRNADVSAKNKDNWTCLHHAVHKLPGNDTQIILALLRSGAVVNAPSLTGETALHMAVKHCKKAVAELLLDNGADVHAQDSAKDTALYFALREEYNHLIELLLNRGAKYNWNELSDLSQRMKDVLKAREKKAKRRRPSDDRSLAPTTSRQSADTSTSRSSMSSSHGSLRSLYDRAIGSR